MKPGARTTSAPWSSHSCRVLARQREYYHQDNMYGNRYVREGSKATITSKGHSAQVCSADRRHESVRGLHLRGLAQYHWPLPGPAWSERGGCWDRHRLGRTAWVRPAPGFGTGSRPDRQVLADHDLRLYRPDVSSATARVGRELAGCRLVDYPRASRQGDPQSSP